MEPTKTKTVTVRLTEDEAELIRIYAMGRNINISEAIRAAILERIENEYDLELLKHATAYKTYSHKEMKRRLGLH